MLLMNIPFLKSDIRRRWHHLGQNLFENRDVPKRQIGTAMYGISSYFNHSCDPNVTFIIGGKANVMLATRAVRAGQELCISYGPTFAFTARGGRLTEVSYTVAAACIILLYHT